MISVDNDISLLNILRYSCDFAEISIMTTAAVLIMISITARMRYPLKHGYQQDRKHNIEKILIGYNNTDFIGSSPCDCDRLFSAHKKRPQRLDYSPDTEQYCPRSHYDESVLGSSHHDMIYVIIDVVHADLSFIIIAATTLNVHHILTYIIRL